MHHIIFFIYIFVYIFVHYCALSLFQIGLKVERIMIQENYVSKELLLKNENKCFLPQHFVIFLHLGAMGTARHSLILDIFL